MPLTVGISGFCAVSVYARVPYDRHFVDALVPTYALREVSLYPINGFGVAIGTTVGITPIGFASLGFTWTLAGGSVAMPLNWLELPIAMASPVDWLTEEPRTQLRAPVARRHERDRQCGLIRHRRSPWHAFRSCSPPPQR
ncbi:MAG: hypothetical protein ACKVW3_14450 [Phycisphaerales bacterium]